MTEKENELKKYKEDEENGLLIRLPFSIGSPVIKIEFNQHDGYGITAKQFELSDLFSYKSGYIFSEIGLALDKVRKLNKENQRSVNAKY